MYCRKYEVFSGAESLNSRVEFNDTFVFLSIVFDLYVNSLKLKTTATDTFTVHCRTNSALPIHMPVCVWVLIVGELHVHVSPITNRANTTGFVPGGRVFHAESENRKRTAKNFFPAPDC